MLDYRRLSNELDTFLSQQKKDVLGDWLEMDRKRMAFAFKNKVPQTFKNKDCGGNKTPH